MTDLTCGEFGLISPELALGVADARERAAALEHLEHCSTCRRETLQLSDIADALAALTPAAEPPAGFESRVLASLGRAQSPVAMRRLTPRRAWQAAAAAALALLIAAGGWAVADRGSHAPSVADGHLITAPLVAHQGTVGGVIIVTGKDPWISMALQMNLAASDTVSCQLRLQNGGTVTVGTFSPSKDYSSYWAAAVDPESSPVDGAQVVDAAGHVLARASFPSQRL